MRKLTGALLAVALLAWAPAVLAQGSDSDGITAQANVLSAVDVTAQQNLDFGNVIPGTNKSVPITDASAGRWLVQGTAGAQVNLQFTALPANLVDGGSNTLPIQYSSSDSGHNATNDPGTATTFDPASGTLANIGPGPAELYVWVGGTVVPGGAQPTGLYTGTITLQASYTGS